MNERYFLNTNTAVLHTNGYCRFSKLSRLCEEKHIKSFSTEDEAYAFAGKRIRPCKLCEAYKEQILRDLENKQGTK